MSGKVTCTDCGEETPKAEAMEREGGHLCEECDKQAFCKCDRCGCELSISEGEDRYSENSSGPYCEGCYDYLFTSCHSCSTELSNNSSDRYSANGDDYCSECYHENFTDCDACGNTVDREDSYYNERRGVDLCGDCHRGDSDYSEFDALPFRSEGTMYSEIRSRRKFGVELETACCPNHDDIEGNHPFGAKEDGSIDGMEFESSVLYGDDGLQAIRNFCRFANANDFEIDGKCGYHVHIDMTGDSVVNLRRMVYAMDAFYPVFKAFVSSRRASNDYCHSHHWDFDTLDRISDYSDFRNWCSGMSRYFWCNFTSYLKFKTCEIRLHHGTVDADAVCNWVKAFARFMDWAAATDVSELRAFKGKPLSDLFAKLATIWDDRQLSDYYQDRAARNGHSIIYAAKVKTC